MTLAIPTREELSGLDPRTLPKLEAWYDAQWVNGFGAADPGEDTQIAQWNDLSGKGRHLTQPTSTKRPFWTKASRNLLVPSLTTLFTGCTVDGNGIYTAGPGPSYSGAQFWAHIPNGNGATINFAADWFATTQSPAYPGLGGAFVESHYFAEDKTTPVYNTSPSPGPYTGNGWASSYPLNAWTRKSSAFTVGPGIYWVMFRFASSTYVSSGTKFRNVDFHTLIDSTRSYVAPSVGPSVMFDGVDDWMNSAAVAVGTVPVSVYVVGSYCGTNNSGSTNHRWFECMNNGNSFGAPVFTLFPVANNVAMFTFNSSGGILKSGLPAIAQVVACGLADGVNMVSAAFNGGLAAVNSSNAGISGMTQTFAMSALATAQALFGNISVALAFSKKHDTATQRRIINWLAARYGITLARP
jgi:hypothetical protein